MSIRNYSIGIAVALCAIVAVATVEMFGAIRLIEQTSNDLFDASEGLRIAAETQRSLREYNRAARSSRLFQDSLHTEELKAAREQLVQNLAAARRYVDTPEEGNVLDGVDRQLKALFNSEVDGASSLAVREESEAIVNSIETLVRINEVQAIDAQKATASMTRKATVWAMVLAIVLIAASAGTIMFMYWKVCAPLQALRKSIVAYHSGGELPPVPVRGPAEVADVAHAFNALAERLEVHRRQQQTFMAAVAHDMLNPLNAMKLALAAGVTSEGEISTDFWKRMPALINRQVNGLQHMVSDLLDLVLLERGNLKINKRPNDLCRIARHVIELFQSSSSKHPIKFSAPGEPLETECDETRIEQVIGNLVHNAIKYSPGGGSIDVSLERRDESAILTVADQGVGISAENQRHLFEPFCRVGETDTMIPGIGLGLSIARMLVLKHGGRIELRSELGIGSAFRVILPLSAVPAPVR
jgi:signal transduction histidine kinase